MKKLIALLLGVCMVLSMAACGGNSTTATTAAATEAATEAPTTEAPTEATQSQEEIDQAAADEVAALIGRHGRIAVHEVADHLIGRVVGPPGAGREVAADFGGAAVDQHRLFGGSRSESGKSAGHDERRGHQDCQDGAKEFLHSLKFLPV